MKKAEETSKEVCTFEHKNYKERDLKIDKILTSKTVGIPIMILFLGIIFWITIVGANYPSEFLFNVFVWGESYSLSENSTPKSSAYSSKISISS